VPWSLAAALLSRTRRCQTAQKCELQMDQHNGIGQRSTSQVANGSYIYLYIYIYIYIYPHIIYIYIGGCPKQTGGSYVIRPTKCQTINLHGPMGPRGAMGPHGDPWGPMGTHGPIAPKPAGRGGTRRAGGGRGRRRLADSATQFGSLRSRHLFQNKMKHICFGRPHIHIWLCIFLYLCT